MAVRILITGGAGFIGSALTRHLTKHGGYRVTILDSLSPQIHGEGAAFSGDLQGMAHCIVGDVRNREDLQKALRGHEIVVHLAAETGTGQSMYEIHRYTLTNVDGTALLLEECGKPNGGIQKVVVASSRAIYGEGKHRCTECGVVYPGTRRVEEMKAGDFKVHCPTCARVVEAVSTDEDSPMLPVSVYGSTKACQEQLVTIWGQAHDVPTVALRFQNVYGPGQSLSNPYTGILSIFSGLILAGEELDIYEDGRESRDFIYIDDAVEAIAKAIEADETPHRAYNVGTGRAASISDVARLLMRSFGKTVPATVSGHFRAGDIRHNFADTKRCREELGFATRWSLEAGLEQLARWVVQSGRSTRDISSASAELRRHNLLMQGKVTGKVG